MFKRILCGILAMSLSVAAFAVSASADETATAANLTVDYDAEVEAAKEGIDYDSDPYEVNYLYLVAMEGADQSAVNDALNELMLSELNMTINTIPMTFGTYNSQISLMLSSGEPLDVFPGMAAQFATYIESDYIENCADYSDYTQQIYDVLGEDADGGYVGDFLVGFSNVKERSYPAGLVCRADLLAEAGYTVDDFAADNSYGVDFDKITELFAKVKELHPDMTIMDGTSIMALQTESYGDNLGNVYGYLENYGQTLTVTNWFESDEYRNFVTIAHDWFSAGYLSSDIAVNTDSGEIKMKAGNTFCFMTNVKPNTNVEKLAQTGYEVEIIPCSVPMKHSNAVTADLTCVSTAAEDPVKAFQFMNWSYVSAEFNNLINWGIEGTDYVVTDDGMAAYPDGVDASSVGYHNDYGFIYPNQMCGYPWVGNEADIWEVYAEYNANTTKSQAFGFLFDSVPVETEIAQLTSVYNQYYKDVGFGVLDVDEGIQTFNDALYDAGLQTVIDEKQAQLDEWVAAQE